MPPKRKPREWGHPEGLPLEEVDEQQLYDGVVTNVSPFGVFVDFGAVKDGLLRVPKQIGRGYRRGMEVKGMAVIACEPEEGKVILQPDPDSLPEPPPKRSSRSAPPGTGQRGGGGGGRQGGASRRASSRPRRPKDWDPSQAVAIDDLRVGDVYDGVVTNVSPYGVFIDIGATRDARLNIPAKFGKRFRIGDVVKECTLETVDVEGERLGASIEDPEEATKDLPPKERAAKPKPTAQGKAQGKAKVKAKGEAKAQARAPARTTDGNVIPIEDLEVGSLCDGIVSNRNQFGVFVNIGCGKDAKLSVSKKLALKFRKGDEVYGMKIETVDVENNLIAVSLDDPELSVDEDEEQAPAPPPQPAKRPAASAPAAKRAASVGAKPKTKTAPKPKAANRATSVDGAPKAKSAVNEHPRGVALNRFRPGSHANGVVTSIGSRGVLVNVGAVSDGLLQLPRHIAKQFQVEDEVRGMTVEGIDDAGERLLLSLDDPELEEPDEPMPPPRAARGGAARAQEPATKAKAKGKAGAAGAGGQAKAKPKASPEPKAKPAAAKAKTKAKAKAAAPKDWTHPEALSFEDLEAGMEVSGVVTNSNQFGVFIDFGAVRDGKLRLEKKFWRTYKSGHQVEGLVIESVDSEAGSIWLRPTDVPEDAEIEEEEAPPARPQNTQRKALASKPAAAPKRAASKSGTGAPATGAPKRAAAAQAR